MNQRASRALILPVLLAATAAFAPNGLAGVPVGTPLLVNSLADNTIAGDGLVTLREAIIAANTGGTTDLGQTAGGIDVIDLRQLYGTIVLSSPLPAITTEITLFGNGALYQEISGGVAGARHRLFFIDGGDLQVIGLLLRNGFARGGAGGSCQQRSGCGGGGVGAGGTAFLDSGRLRMLQVAVIDSHAEGGPGGTRELPAGDHGGGGGGGLALAGAAPGLPAGGVGAAGSPMGGVGGAPGGGGKPGGQGGDGAGGGGGSAGTAEDTHGGPGGFGAGGGGGGLALGSGPATPVGGAGGLGGGGGGRGGSDSAPDGPGAPGGAFGGQGGASSSAGTTGGGGGGGAGLGGAIFVRSGTVDLQAVTFNYSRALRGAPGDPAGGNAGQPGLGKGGALFLMPSVTALLTNVVFNGNSAADSSGSGYQPGQASDSHDVFGVVSDSDRVYAYGFD